MSIEGELLPQIWYLSDIHCPGTNSKFSFNSKLTRLTIIYHIVTLLTFSETLQIKRYDKLKSDSNECAIENSVS